MESKIAGKLEKLYAAFDHNGTINRLQLSLLLRTVLDSVGFMHVHDVDVVKTAVEIVGTEKLYTPSRAEIKKDRLVSCEVLKMIVECLNRNPVPATSGEEEKMVSPLGTEKLIEFVGANFARCDYMKEGKISLDCALLLFRRICFTQRPSSPSEIYTEFIMHSGGVETRRDQRLDREALTRLLAEYTDRVAGERRLKNRLRPASSLAVIPEQRRSRTILTETSGSETNIRRISSRFDVIESAINRSRAMLENECGVDYDVAKAAIGCRLRSGQATPSRAVFRSLGHRCSSEYCLLCRNSAYK